MNARMTFTAYTTAMPLLLVLCWGESEWNCNAYK